MHVIHISPIYNRSSIFKSGIIPTPIKNSSHKEAFEKYDCCTPDGKAIYTWEDGNYNSKFVEDLIYAYVYIHPRNLIYENTKENDYYLNFYKQDKRLPIFNYSQMLFDVYKIRIKDESSFPFIHTQFSSGEYSPYSTTATMHDKWAHDDKPLRIYKEPLKDIKIIGQGLYYFNNKINIKILK